MTAQGKSRNVGGPEMAQPNTMESIGISLNKVNKDHKQQNQELEAYTDSGKTDQKPIHARVISNESAGSFN